MPADTARKLPADAAIRSRNSALHTAERARHPGESLRVPWTVERKLITGLASTVLSLAVIAVLTAYTVQRLYRAWTDVHETHLLIFHLASVLNTAQDIETGARGYAISGDEVFLPPFVDGSARLDRQLAVLNELPDGVPADDLAAIAKLARERRDASTELVVVRRQQGLEAAAEHTRLLKGKVVMDALRERIGIVRQREMDRLEAQVPELRHLTGLAFFAACALAILVAAMAGLLHLSVSRDLARKRADDDALRKAAETTHDLYNNAPCGYHSLDAEGRFLQINDTELRWLGYARDEVVGRLSLRDLLTPQGLENFAAHFEEFKKTGIVHDLSFDLRRKDGSLLPVLVSATAVYDGDGRFLRSRSSVFDNTESRRLQEEQHRVFALVPDLLCVCGFDGVFRRVNDAWQRTLGHPLEDLLRLPFLDFVHPDDREATTAEMSGLLDGREVTHFENRYRHADGSYRWLAWKSSPDLQRGLIYASARDVTEQRETDRMIATLNGDLRRYNTRLEAANKELEAFSYSVSHDLRAPLRSIDGFSRVLIEDCAAQLGDEGRSHLQRIIRATNRMAELIDDMTRLSRVTRAELHPQRVDLSATARSIIEGLRQRSPERVVDVQVSDDLVAEGDPALLRIVLENLLENAWKFTARLPRARIEVGRLDGKTPPVFFVRDNGAGFDMAYAGRLFGAFQRLHTEADFPGTGIGLATVQRIVNRHGGRVWAEGEVGSGAMFSFTLA